MIQNKAEKRKPINEKQKEETENKETGMVHLNPDTSSHTHEM